MALAAILASSTQAQNEDTLGKWDPPPGGYDWPVEAMHAVHLSSGNILVWKNPLCQNSQGPPRLWNPADGLFTNVELEPGMSTVDCAGHAALADGSILVTGGGCGPANAHRRTAIFQLTGPTPWTTASDMSWDRWYPTCTTLGDGRILTVAGSDNVADPPPYDIVLIPEVYNPTSKMWQELSTAVRELGIYAFMFLVPDGTVFYAGPQTQTAVLDTQSWTWSEVGSSWPLIGARGSAVMYEPGKVLKCGGTAHDGFTEDLTAIIDLNDPNPQWDVFGSDPMQEPRRNHNLVVLPDGKILAVGGEQEEPPGSGNWVPVMPAEVFDPDAPEPTWTSLAPMEGDPREHHSSAVLLPNATVLACGGEGYASAEIFSPPYLFVAGAPRPMIGYAPTVVEYGVDFAVNFAWLAPQGGAGQIDKVSLVRLATVTHGFDQNQRFVPLNFLGIGDTRLRVEAPANGNVAPPGYYMLFLVSEDGVPSIAKYVRLYEPATT